MRTCLLVDDVNMNLRVLNAIMQKADYSSVCASSGKEALRVLNQSSVDLILTDLWMPEMNGEELLKAIRGIKEFNHIPVVAITADVECNENFDMRNFDGTLIKPVNVAMINDILQDIYTIRQNRQRDGAVQ